MKIFQSSPAQVNPSDLTFATKFVAVYLFIKVKGSHPMTYQYLTVDMIATAKEKGRFIDQKTFKTAGKYGFDSLILTDANMQVLNGYISYVRPLVKPQCDFFLVNRNGGQHGKLGKIMSKLVFGAIRKYIHPTLKRKASISSPARSKGFCRKTRNTVLLLPKFTIKSGDHAKLL